MFSFKNIFILLSLIISDINAQWIPNSVWCIVNVSYNEFYDIQNHKIVYNIGSAPMGSCFFVSKTQFVTANHCFRHKQPLPGYNNYKIILVSSDGDIIQNFTLDVNKPDYDIMIGSIPDTSHKVYVWELDENYNSGDELYNLGYPGEQTLKQSVFNIHIDDNQLIVKDTIRLLISSIMGKVVKDSNMTIEIDGLKLEEKDLILIDYFPPFGYSGSPAITLMTNKVVGLMSFGEYSGVYLPQYDEHAYWGNGKLIPAKYINQFLSK